MNNKLEVIGIDHGWSMMKTISQVFVTGVKEITTTPALFGDVLEYEGKFYKVGTVRQEVKDTKVEDDSFYLLTLAAVAKELKRRGLAEAKVFLAVGLPLTRFGAEKNDFIKYLTKNKRVSFKYENESYHIEIDDVAVFPQCYAAVVDKIPAMAKKTLIVDIGSWTIDIMPVINKSPDESKCVTIPKGLITCMRSINEQCVRQLNGEVDESEIQDTNEVEWEHYISMREYSGLTLKDGKYNLEDVMKSMMDAYETRYNYIVKEHENGERRISYDLTGENSLTLDDDLAGLDRAYNKRLANLAGYIVCQQTNDGSKFFQTTNVKKNTAEQKEYIDTAVSMMEKAQKRFLEMREEPKYTAGIAKSVIWDIMSSDKNFMETTQRLFAKTIYHNAKKNIF